MSESPTVLRAVIASDNFLTREGLGCLLDGVRSIEVVARVDSHPETLEAVSRYRPDVLVVGIRTPRVNAEASLSASSICSLASRIRPRVTRASTQRGSRLSTSSHERSSRLKAPEGSGRMT